MNNTNLAAWMRLTPDVQDALLSGMESRARPPFIEDSVALTNEAVRNGTG